MALKIRLARGGTKKRPFYRVVIAENTAPRDGSFIEKIGTYNPMVGKDHPNRLTIQEDRVKYWLSVGARPTDRVHKFLANLNLMPAFAYNEQPIKSAPGKKRLEREAEQKAADEAAKEAAAEEALAEEAPRSSSSSRRSSSRRSSSRRSSSRRSSSRRSSSRRSSSRSSSSRSSSSRRRGKINRELRRRWMSLCLKNSV